VTEEGFLNVPRRIGRLLLCSRTGYLPVILVAALVHTSVIALASTPASTPTFTPGMRGPVDPQGAGEQGPALTLPPGSQLCPFSGPGAACDASASVSASPGQPSLPDGL